MLVKLTIVRTEYEPQSDEDRNNGVAKVFAGMKEVQPIWVNPDRVILLHSGKNETSIIRVSENETIWVKGTPDEVVEKLNDTL